VRPALAMVRPRKSIIHNILWRSLDTPRDNVFPLVIVPPGGFADQERKYKKNQIITDQYIGVDLTSDAGYSRHDMAARRTK
jgi:hypothetical protein